MQKSHGHRRHLLQSQGYRSRCAPGTRRTSASTSRIGEAQPFAGPTPPASRRPGTTVWNIAPETTDYYAPKHGAFHGELPGRRSARAPRQAAACRGLQRRRRAPGFGIRQIRLGDGSGRQQSRALGTPGGRVGHENGSGSPAPTVPGSPPAPALYRRGVAGPRAPMAAERFFSEHPWETGRSGPRAGLPATATDTSNEGSGVRGRVLRHSGSKVGSYSKRGRPLWDPRAPFASR